MATMWRKAMLYLGLGPDDDYDDDAAFDDRAGRGTGARLAGPGPDVDSATVRPIPARPGVRGTGRVSYPGGDSPVEEVSAVTMRPSGGPSVVRTFPAKPNAKPRVVIPRSFNQAQEIADFFREGQPVIMNLQQLERELSRRLIDFASGLCYGLNGKMEKVANQVYLLSPANVEVSAEDRRRINERDAHD